MLIKLNRSVRQLCMSLARSGGSTSLVRCHTTQPPCCSQTGNAIKLVIARRGCPDTFWQPISRSPCAKEITSDCGCMQELIGNVHVPAIALNYAPFPHGCPVVKPVVIEYSVVTCAPNGAICFRLDDLLFKQLDGRYHAVVTNGLACMWDGQIDLSDGAIRLKEYTTQSGASCATC